jgi:hypothetical protein
VAETTLMFGDTGSGKTTALGEAAQYLYKMTGGKTGRAVYTDVGGWKPIQGMVDAGIIEPYNIIGEPNMPKLLHKLAQGYWPTRLEGGLRPPDVKLIRSPAETWNQIGFYLYEGITSSSELLMKFLRDTQQPIGGDAVGKFTIKADPIFGEEMLFCSNNMKHYDWVQGEMLVVLAELSSLPVAKVIITAHEATGQDNDTKDPIRGAAFVGKAATAKVGKNVGDYIHVETYSKVAGEVINTTRRAYFMAHPDPKFPNITYGCKPRIPLTEIGPVLKQFPGGYFDPKDLGLYLEACDRAVERSTATVKEWKQAVDRELALAKQAV